MKVEIRLLTVLLLASFFISSCGSRKHVVTPAARAAEAMSNIKSKQLYSFITSWAGVRYKLGGLDKNGIDCSGFALRLQKEIYNLNLPRRSRDQAAVIKDKQLRQLDEGDLIFFSFAGSEVDHVGVYLNNNFFVHASTTKGVIVDDLSLPAYQKSFVKAGSLK